MTKISTKPIIDHVNSAFWFDYALLCFCVVVVVLKNSTTISYIWVSIGSANVFLPGVSKPSPDGTKPLSESILTYHQCDSVTSITDHINQFSLNYTYLNFENAWYLMRWTALSSQTIFATSPTRGAYAWQADGPMMRMCDVLFHASMEQ